ncbi:hypothetical protein BT69DRAFT_1350147 [Atractiella rhizophila]|nr:hypothetical protein BT69DRAFT_1350147 [Atractiella rhizophila]
MSTQASTSKDRQPHEHGEEKKKRRRQALSCEYCRRRRVRCDRQPQCSSCTSRGRECVWEDGVVPTGNTSSEVEELKREVAYLAAQIAERDRELARYRLKSHVHSNSIPNPKPSLGPSIPSTPLAPPQLDWDTLSSFPLQRQQRVELSPSPSDSSTSSSGSFSRSHLHHPHPAVTAPSVPFMEQPQQPRDPLIDFLNTLRNAGMDVPTFFNLGGSNSTISEGQMGLSSPTQSIGTGQSLVDSLRAAGFTM